MTVVVITIAGLQGETLATKGIPCQALTFAGDDWRPCRATARERKAELNLCSPHTRLPEIEVEKGLTV